MRPGGVARPNSSSALARNNPGGSSLQTATRRSRYSNNIIPPPPPGGLGRPRRSLAKAGWAPARRPSRRGRRVTGNRLPNRFHGLFGPPFDGFPPDFLSLLDRGDPDAVDAVEPLQHPLPVPDALRLDAHHDGGDAVVVVETLVHLRVSLLLEPGHEAIVVVELGDEMHPGLSAKADGELGSDFLHSGLVAAAVSNKDDVLETVGLQARGNVPEKCLVRFLSQADGSGVAHVSRRWVEGPFGDERNDGGYESVSELSGDRVGHRLEHDVVLAGDEVRPLLLDPPGSHENGALSGLDGVAHLHPGEVLDENRIDGLDGTGLVERGRARLSEELRREKHGREGKPDSHAFALLGGPIESRLRMDVNAGEPGEERRNDAKTQYRKDKIKETDCEGLHRQPLKLAW